MERKILESCPSCSGPLEITEVRCLRCGTEVRAHYQPCDFCSLSEEQSTFLRLFVTSRGNLSEVEKRLGVSYPTVRAKLDEVIQRLEGSRDERASSAPTAPTARAALERSVAEAVERLGPAIEARVREVVGRLGATRGAQQADPSPGTAPQPPATRREILDAVARSELSAAEGLERIRAMGGEQ